MPYEVLERQIRTLPETARLEVERLVVRLSAEEERKAEDPLQAEKSNALVESRLAALHEFAGSMKTLWKDEEPLEYQKRQREEREIG